MISFIFFFRRTFIRLHAHRSGPKKIWIHHWSFLFDLLEIMATAPSFVSQDKDAVDFLNEVRVRERNC
jgi:hypothetical protein